MYELSRVLLRSVGPSGARYENVLLDLSRVGRPVEHQQDELFDTGERALRPSPATVLFLENGGGKSVLLKLVFSVLLPGRRDIVGGSDGSVLGDFVGARDVSHVVLEWTHSATGRLLVTGKAMAWKGQVVSSTAENLQEFWYTFYPGATLCLENLPLVEDGRYLTLSAFRSQMNVAQAEDPRLDLYWLKTHREWADRLSDLGLDTELFRYQRHMNADEGEAVRAFTLESDELFVDFLLSAVLSEEELTPLADLVEEHVDQLSKRGARRLEQEFVEDALAVLGPLQEHAARAALSQRHADQAQASLQQFAGRIAARRNRENASLTQLHDEEQQARKALAEATEIVDGLRRREQALRLRKAVLDLKAAKDEVDEAETAASYATAEVRGWENTGKVLSGRETAAKAERLRDLVTDRSAQVRPALEARAIAAQRLARGLLGLARQAEDAAMASDKDAVKHKKEEIKAREAERKAVTAAAKAKAEIERLESLVSSVDQLLDDAVQTGLLDSRDALTTTCSTAKKNLEETVKERIRLQKELDARSDERPELDAALRLAEQTASGYELHHAQALGTVRTAHERRDLLQAQDRLAELLGTDDVQLDQDAPALPGLLAEAIAASTRDTVRLMTEDAEEERARRALAEGKLLPPPAEVVSACAALTTEEILAWSGWEYVADIPDPDQRNAFVRAHPHLVSGILLNSPGDLDDARRILSDPRFRSTSFVPVTATGALHEPDGDQVERPRFVLPFHPALYDPDAAEHERQEIEGRHQNRTEALAELAPTRARDEELTRRVESWLEDYPAGRVNALEQQCGALAEKSGEAAVAVKRATRAVEENEKAHSRARNAIQITDGKIKELEELVRRLETLAVEAEKVPGRRSERRTWLGAERADREAAERHRGSAEGENGKATECLRAADERRREAAGLREELSALPGAEEVTAAAPEPSEPVPVLRSLFSEAAERFRSSDVSPDLKTELRAAENAATAAATACETIPAEIRDRAEELLKTPAGATVAGRAAGLRQAEHVEKDKTRTHSEALERHGASRAEERREREAWQDSFGGDPVDDLTDAPPDSASCQARIMEVLKAQEAATWAVRVLGKELETRRGTREEAGIAARDFGILAKTLQEEMPDTVHVPYEGNYSAAESECGVLATARRSTRSTASADAEELRKTGNALHRHTMAARYALLGAAVQREINASESGRLAEGAARWESLLQPRLRALTEQLEQAERHRRSIITVLKGEVGKALDVLRLAQRVSKLPSSLGAWHNEEFLRFQFERPGDELLLACLGEVVDEAAAGRTSDGRKVRRTGLALVLRAVHASVPKGFKVTILKPDTTLRAERERVSRVKKVFSGGQQLTAAILLYCTMAALRANDRGRRLDRRAGLLFLDNPIGRANADYLLDLQRAEGPSASSSSIRRGSSTTRRSANSL